MIILVVLRWGRRHPRATALIVSGIVVFDWFVGPILIAAELEFIRRLLDQ